MAPLNSRLFLSKFIKILFCYWQTKKVPYTRVNLWFLLKVNVRDGGLALPINPS